MSRPSTKTIEAFADLIRSGATVEQVEAKTQLKQESIGRYLRWAKEEGNLPEDTCILDGRFLYGESGLPFTEAATHITREESGAGMCLTIKSARIKTVEDALDYAQVDLSQWEVDRFVVNSWEVALRDQEENLEYVDGKATGYLKRHRGAWVEPLWQVKVWLKRKALDIDKAIEQIAGAFEGIGPAHEPVEFRWPHSGTLAEIAFMDLHFGKACWGDETGTDYDHKIATRCFETALDEQLGMAVSVHPEKILMPIGNDLLHVDNIEGATTRGTRQDIDTRPQLLFERTVEMLVRGIRKARQLAPVHVLIIPGNHDVLSAHHVGAALQGWFHDCDDVVIDNGPSTRKYFEWGKVLLGFCHGGKDDPKPADLPLLMAVERREAWANATHCEWHTGHIHKRKATSWLSTDANMGIHIRTLPSLCGTDAWHAQHGYVEQPRVVEMYFWDKETGYRGHTSTVPVQQAVEL